jgi:hypothetical protein
MNNNIPDMEKTKEGNNIDSDYDSQSTESQVPPDINNQSKDLDIGTGENGLDKVDETKSSIEKKSEVSTSSEFYGSDQVRLKYIKAKIIE